MFPILFPISEPRALFRAGSIHIIDVDVNNLHAAGVSHEELTVELFTRWSRSFDEMAGSLRDTFAVDCLWDQRPMVITRGPNEAEMFLRRARAVLGLQTADVKLLDVAVAGGCVHTERVDYLRRADGSLIAEVPVAGVLRWEAGRLAAWREYFDVASVATNAIPSYARWATDRGLGAFRALAQR